MAWNSLKTGPITITAGTPIQVASSHIAYQSVLIQVMPNNRGLVVVGSDSTVRANSGATNPSGSILAILGAPTSTTATPPSANGGNPTAPAAFNLQDLWIDGTTNGDACFVSYIR